MIAAAILLLAVGAMPESPGPPQDPSSTQDPRQDNDMNLAIDTRKMFDWEGGKFYVALEDHAGPNHTRDSKWSATSVLLMMTTI